VSAWLLEAELPLVFFSPSDPFLPFDPFAARDWLPDRSLRARTARPPPPSPISIRRARLADAFGRTIVSCPSW
jgi:hypothetical protein